ncbi:hypothetical protein [Clostridium sp.]|uniref:hypothetical protein n=1 Tax=Clostridium sp. TaxID=1506 RepID=UPI0034640C98
MKKINKPLIYGSVLIITFVLIKIISLALVDENNLNSRDLKKHLGIKDKQINFGVLKNDMITDQGVSFDFSDFTGEYKPVEFTANKGDKVELIDESSISQGKLYIAVLDSNYKDLTLHKLDKQPSFNIVVPEDGKYFISLIGKNSSGDLNLKLNFDSNIKITKKDIWD